MSPFKWRVLIAFCIILLAFSIATLTVTLIMISEIRADTIDYDKVTFVEVANWIYVGVLGICVLCAMAGTPYFIAYTRGSDSLVATKLKPPNV